MLNPYRLAYRFARLVVPNLPHQITTIYKPQNLEYAPPNAQCMLPAAAMGTIAAITEWTDANILLTSGLTGIGLFIYSIKAMSYSMQLKQIDASQDFSKLYFHFNGGWIADRIFNRINKETNPQIIYDRETGILEIPSTKVSAGSFTKNTKTDYKNMYLRLDLFNSKYTLPVGSIDLQTNLQVDYRDQLRIFCDQRHEEGLL